LIDPDPLDRPEGILSLALLLNGAVLAVIAVLWVIEDRDSLAYYLLVQEDGVLEWATVLLLLPAIWLCAKGMRLHRAATDAVPWFFAGLLAFCVFFAGEEISWGQRLMAYQPPEYFLEHNSQQELNVHNLFKKHLRTKVLLRGILLLYGIVLPLLNTFVPPAKRLIRRLGIIAPPALLVPAFTAVYLLIKDYPWKYTGEVAECLFALTLFLSIALRVDALQGSTTRLDVRLAATLGSAALLAWVTPGLLGAALHGSDEERVARAEAEVGALVDDWFTHTETEGRPSKCGAHIRVFTWVRKHDLQTFREGEFAGLNMDDARRRFFLDPWNNPYWIRHVCKRKKKKKYTKRIFVYSFGPDSRRNSTKKKLQGDDVGERFKPSDR
jgi:hypothetical protein